MIQYIAGLAQLQEIVQVFHQQTAQILLIEELMDNHVQEVQDLAHTRRQ